MRLTRVRQFLEPRSATPAPAHPAPAIRRVKHQRVARDRAPLWYVRGWRQDGNRYFGCYSSAQQRFRGELFANRDGTYQPYISNPPAAALTGPHHYCFIPERTAGYFRVHLCLQARSVDDAIRAVEAVL